MSQETATVEKKELIYELNGKPPLSTAIPIGMQHVMSMFVGNIAPVLLLSAAAGLDKSVELMLMQCAMLISGLVTLLQLYPIKIGKFQIGSGLPVVMGTSFAVVPTVNSVLKTGVGAAGVFGASLLGSIVELIMGFFMKPLKKIFPPVVVGSILLVIGLNLLRTGANYFAGGGSPASNPLYGSPANLLIALEVLLIIVLLQRFAKGLLKTVAVLVGIIIGYITALIVTNTAGIPLISFEAFNGISPFILPKPFAAGVPKFDGTMVQPFISFAIIYIVLGLETMGNTSGVAMAAFNREASGKETSGSVMANAIGSGVGAIFNALPSTAFAQNVGIVQLTGVINKFCVACGAIFLILAGFIPPIGAAFMTIPSCVLGGALISVFAMITINAIRMLSKAGFEQGNVLTLSMALGVGYGLSLIVSDLPETVPSVIRFILHDAVIAVALVAVISNLIFNGISKEKDIDDVGAEMEESGLEE